MKFIFDDYIKTKVLYHVIELVDLEQVMDMGIKYDDKQSYNYKYIDFHSYFDQYKPPTIPQWVERKRSIFMSMNFKEGHSWHSHSALLKVKVSEESCWVCNENIANFLYEPLILKGNKYFKEAADYIDSKGKGIVEDYWSKSLSFTDNLTVRNDKKEGYDAEVLVLHDIPPKDIECYKIISDHSIMEYNEWKNFFKANANQLKL